MIACNSAGNAPILASSIAFEAHGHARPNITVFDALIEVEHRSLSINPFTTKISMKIC